MLDTTTPPQLSDREWSVVAAALEDASRCGCAASTRQAMGLIEKLAAALFARRRSEALTDPRLLAVSEFVCHANRQREPSPELAAALVEHGFSPRQIDALAMLSL